MKDGIAGIKLTHLSYNHWNDKKKKKKKNPFNVFFFNRVDI